MNQEKIGKFIRELRKSKNMTQKEFADKFGVTYQAVSKWENGKNIPDISILKDMCEEFSIDINEVLDLNINKIDKNNKKNKYILISSIIGFIVILIVIFIVIINIKDNNSFEFKAIEANCDNFNIYGNMAYNSNKSYISISKIEYCGNTDETIYKNIECNLYEIDGNKENKVSDCGYDIEKETTLDEYLNNVKFNINNYSTMCADYSESNFELKIEATTLDNKITVYKIPISIKDNC